MGLKKNELFSITLDYFKSFLPLMRKSSPATIRTYQVALEQYLDYLKSKNNVQLYQVTISMMNKKAMSEYLDYLETEMNCSVSTRNHRRACIRAFLKYAATCSIEAAGIWNEIQAVPKAVDATKPVEYMTIKAVEAIISQPDTSTRKGKRDSFLLLFLYQTGARVQELVDVRICDLSIDTRNVATLHGKGSKTRSIPMREKLVGHLKKYLEVFHPRVNMYSTDTLFYSIHCQKHTRMTEDNVRKLVKSYGRQALEKEPTVPENVHPHMFRHSIAMHLYQNGVALPLVSQWLGHSRLETTLIYAYADTEQKRKAIESAIPEDSTLKAFLNSERYCVDDDNLIKQLYGLK